MSSEVKEHVRKEIPFERQWLDSNGFLTNAWEALKKYPEANHLVGHIDPDLDDHTAMILVEKGNGTKVSIKLFSIAENLIKQQFTYKKRLQANVSYNPNEKPLDYIPVPAIALITRGAIEVHMDGIPRGQQTLLEKWVLVSVTHTHGVVRDVHFKTHYWRMVERTTTIQYGYSPNDWPVDTYEFVCHLISEVYVQLQQRGGMEVIKRQMEDQLKERWRKIGALRKAGIMIDDDVRLNYIEIFHRWQDSEYDDTTFQQAWDTLDAQIYTT